MRIMRITSTSCSARTLTLFGQTVLFHNHRHGGRCLTSEDLEPYRLVGDPELDELLEFMDDSGYPLKAGDDLLENSAYPVQVQERINKFNNQYRTLPEWVDVDQLERGQQVFLSYFAACALSLYYRSLVAGFSIPKLAQVVIATGYLAPPSSPERVAYRLIDTGAMVNLCCGVGGVESVLPDRAGWKACLQVRLLHAKVRRLLLKRTAKPWDTLKYGVPINQEDMAATLLAFSVNTLKGIELIGGISLSMQEQTDFLALWRYIGWLLGIHTEPPSFKSSGSLRPLDPCGPGWIQAQPDPISHSTQLLQSIVLHLLVPDQSSILVAHHLLCVGRPQQGTKATKKERETKPGQSEYLYYSRALMCRYFIGNPLADALALPIHSDWKIRICVQARVFCILLVARALTWTALAIPPGRQYLTKYVLRRLEGFHSLWNDRHPRRMSKALHVDSCCPFAMITPNES